MCLASVRMTSPSAFSAGEALGARTLNSTERVKSLELSYKLVSLYSHGCFVQGIEIASQVAKEQDSMMPPHASAVNAGFCDTKSAMRQRKMA
jgi:hypothetical protein